MTSENDAAMNTHKDIDDIESINQHNQLPNESSFKTTIKRFAFAFGKLALVFLFSGILTFLTLYWLLPQMNQEQRQDLKIPRNIQELEALNRVLNNYIEDYYTRVLISFSVTYIFLQVFSIPGSMWLNILGGALFGVPISMIVVCLLSGLGAFGAYIVSKTILSVFIKKRWNTRLERWKIQLSSKRHSYFTYIILLRIAPFPPNWVCNLASPHLGVPMLSFFTGTVIGVAPPSLIHTQAGTTLNQITKPEDFQIFTFQNVMGLIVIGFGLVLLIIVRRYYGTELTDIQEAVGDSESINSIKIDQNQDEEESNQQENIINEETPLLSSIDKDQNSNHNRFDFRWRLSKTNTKGKSRI